MIGFQVRRLVDHSKRGVVVLEKFLSTSSYQAGCIGEATCFWAEVDAVLVEALPIRTRKAVVTSTIGSYS